MCLIMMLILGSSWASLSWLASLLLASALLAIGCGGLYLASRMRRLLKQLKTIPRITPDLIITAPMAAVKRSSKYVGMLALGLTLGWSLHAAKQFNHTYVLNDVKVLERQADNRYLLQTDHHVDFTFKTCPDSTVDWLAGSKLKVLVYEDRGSCASVSDKQLGYVVYRDKQGRPILTGGL